jgi:uncharacterized repeat protein (TIGR01451 family)
LRTTYSCPFSGDSLDISSGIVTSLITINCYSLPIHSIEGIQYFVSLRNLHCYSDRIDSIVLLPPNLEVLECGSNNISKIISLPSRLTYLNCAGNDTISLPSLPASLQTLIMSSNYYPVLPLLPAGLKLLDVGYCHTITLPSLPSGLTSLNCRNNLIDSIPTLPASLRYLTCSHNPIRSLPSLPLALYSLSCDYDSLLFLPSLPTLLDNLTCNNNKLSYLPTLPSTLRYLKCSNNKLENLPPLPSNLVSLICFSNNLGTLPTLPSSLSDLYCFSDSLIELPTFPASLSQLNIDDNPYLYCMPYLPHSLLSIHYDGTSISCIPNIVVGASYSPLLGSQPICSPSISSCVWYTSISGSVYLDSNLNCLMDSLEPKLKNVSVFLKQGSSIVNISGTDANGLFAFDSFPFDNYTLDIDTTELPYLLYCPAAGTDTVLIDTLHSEIMSKHLGLQCNSGFDVGSIGMINTSWIRPATLASFDVHAGDMSTLHGASCSFVGGSIAINYSGPLLYSGVAFGTIFPDSILPNRIVWTISDFSTLNFFEDIKPNFFVDSSAIVGDLVCFTTEVTPGAGDRVPSNNLFAQCFDVRASYDPNVKDVSPSGTVTTTQGWMYYTIHFQNTGSSFAENIYVWDTLDANLNMNTIQVMASSHNVSMKIYPINRAAKFSFVDINLIDSATSESASHGYVQYRIKLNDSLIEGTNIHNKASILFDLNTPVITNTATTIICNSPSKFQQALNLSTTGSIRVGTHLYDKAGTYTDILKNVHNCDSVVITKLYLPLGIENIVDSKMKIYPNPANNEVMIRLEGMNNAPLQIFDMYGKLLYENLKYADNYVINTNTFISGSYIIQWGNNHQKLMIKH